MAPRFGSTGLWRVPRLLGQRPTRGPSGAGRRRERRRLAAERLEPRALLAVSAGVTGSELLISLSAAGDTAELRVEGSSFVIRDNAAPVFKAATAGINSIRVTGRNDLANQALVVQPGGVLPVGLAVDAGVESTSIATPIVTSGAVTIDSAAITLGADVRTAGRQAYAGTVRVAADIVLDAGAGDISFGGPIRSTVGLRATLMEDLGAPYRLALSPNGATLYASDAVSNYVYFIDLAAQQLDTVDLGRSVGHVLLNQDGSRLYVANFNEGTVTVLNTATRAVAATVTVPGTPDGMAMSADGQTLFVANYSDDSVSLVSTSTNRVTRKIPVAGGPSSVAAGPGGRLWVASENLNRVSVYSLSPDTLVGQISVGVTPLDIALSPDGSRAYVANNGDGTVSVIDTASLTVIGTLAVGWGPSALTVSPDGRLVYVVNGFSDNVSVIDTSSLSVVTTVPVGNLPVGMAISADGRTAYVANLTSLSELGNDARSLTVRTTGLARFDAPPSTVDPLRALVVEASLEIESAGLVALSVDMQGNLRANGTLISFNGGPVNYQGIAAAGWTAVAAEAIAGVNTVLLRHSSGGLHFWRMDDGWRQVSGDGWVTPDSQQFFDTEVAFGTDLDGDGMVGLITIENAGSVTLAYDGAGHLRANGTLISFNGGPVNYHGIAAAGWTAVAAEAIAGVNTVVLRHSTGGLHFWRMDDNWRQVSGDSWVTPGSMTFFNTEVAFDTDLDGDGLITIESAGSTSLAYEPGGGLFANGTPVTFNGSQANYRQLVAAGWTPMAAEFDQGLNTVVLRHSTGGLHFWRMDDGWTQESGDGWLLPGTTAFFEAEVTFGTDLNDDGILTIETSGSVVFAYDREGTLLVNGSPIGTGGASIDYHGARAAGWTAVAADFDRGVRTVVWRHSTGHLHYWRMDANWNLVSNDGWIALGSAAFFAAEAAFGADLDGDGRRTIESAGGFVLTYDRTGVLRAHEASAGSVDPSGTVITSNGSPLNYHGAAAVGWTVVAADVDGGVRTVVFRHSSGYLHFGRLDSGWNMVSTDSWIAPGSAEYLATEVAFGIDFNANGVIGA